MKSAIILMFSCLLNIASAENSSVGIFRVNCDIGNPKMAGSAIYDQNCQSYILKGGGYNIWFERDEFHYLFNKIKGDFILTANFEFVGKGANPHRKTGWMVRETTDEKSPHISATLHGNGLTVLQWRVSAGTAMRDPQDEIFAPDGKFIYYNGNHTGTMQIWRMKPDGSGREQITFDKFNNWFPHISPDGKWIVIISFPSDVDPNSHPSYKRVMLRIMPVSGGEPKALAYLYGGQGTINVPSWSPDSKKIAFVSNSGKIKK
jgi:WD40 repeat protein